MATPIEDPSYETSALGSAQTRKGTVALSSLQPGVQRTTVLWRGMGQSPMLPGGDYRIRTDDPLLAKQVLYQLS